MSFENFCQTVVVTALVIDHDVVVPTLFTDVPTDVGFTTNNIYITITLMQMIVLDAFFTGCEIYSIPMASSNTEGVGEGEEKDKK